MKNNSVSVMPYIKPFEFEGPASAGDSIQVSCHITKGDPPFTIEWFFDGKPITPHFGVLTGMFGHRSNILSISQVRPVNRGRYTCSVSNPAGRAIFSADLLVNGTQAHTTIRCTHFSVSLLNGSPRLMYSHCLNINFMSIGFNPHQIPTPVWISVVPQLLPFTFGDETVNAGDMTAVQCTVVKGDSPIHIVWLFNGTELKSGDGVAVMTSGTRLSSLSIEVVRAENAGEYTCLARNAAGASNHTAYLHVNGIYLRPLTNFMIFSCSFAPLHLKLFSIFHR